MLECMHAPPRPLFPWLISALSPPVHSVLFADSNFEQQSPHPLRPSIQPQACPPLVHLQAQPSRSEQEGVDNPRWSLSPLPLRRMLLRIMHLPPLRMPLLHRPNLF